MSGARKDGAVSTEAPSKALRMAEAAAEVGEDLGIEAPRTGEAKAPDREVCDGIAFERAPGRCGGAWVLAGTRMTVSTIDAMYVAGMSTDAIQKQYPHLTTDQIEAAIALPEQLGSRWAGGGHGTSDAKAWTCAQCGAEGPNTAEIRHERGCELYGRWYSERRSSEAPRSLVDVALSVVGNARQCSNQDAEVRLDLIDELRRAAHGGERSETGPIAGCGDPTCKGLNCGSIVCGMRLRPGAIGVPTVPEDEAELMKPTSHEEAIEMLRRWTESLGCAAPEAFEQVLTNQAGHLVSALNGARVKAYLAGIASEQRKRRPTATATPGFGPKCPAGDECENKVFVEEYERVDIMHADKVRERAASAIVDWLRHQAAGLSSVNRHSGQIVYEMARQIESLWESIILPREPRTDTAMARWRKEAEAFQMRHVKCSQGTFDDGVPKVTKHDQECAHPDEHVLDALPPRLQRRERAPTETLNARADLSGVEASLTLIGAELREMGISGKAQWSKLRGRASVHLGNAHRHVAALREELARLGIREPVPSSSNGSDA
jgi:uncharacterized protein (DUF433 family)